MKPQGVWRFAGSGLSGSGLSGSGLSGSGLSRSGLYCKLRSSIAQPFYRITTLSLHYDRTNSRHWRRRISWVPILCEQLVERGHDVICLDNFFTSQKSNVSHLLDRPNFELIRHDITMPIFLGSRSNLQHGLSRSPGPLSVQSHQNDENERDGSNQHAGNRKTLWGKDPCKPAPVRSMAIPEIHPQVESYRGSVNPIGIRACYDEGKRAAETLFMDYHRSNKVDVRIVRIFNTYGPRMHPFDGRVVSNFHSPSAGW